MKKILLVSDVKGWGGWKRAEMMKKYLSDEFHFDIVDGTEFNKWEKNPNRSHYDLIYLLFHVMLTKKSVGRLFREKKYNFIAMVTVYPTLRPAFRRVGGVNPKVVFKGLAKECKAILANNQKSLNDLRKLYNGPSTIATRGVDPDIFYPTSDEFKEKPQEDFTVAFCGKPNPEKGFKSIIQPVCKKAGVKLIDNQRNFTNALTQDEMRDFYNSADVYIVASKMDGTPNTALEAAACGKPIISNHIGNMPEFIENEKNGWLVKLKVDEYINKIKWMKENQRKVWEAGKCARETVLKDWTWEKVLNKNERRIFREVLK